MTNGQSKKKALLPGVLFPLLMGGAALTQTLGRPSMASVRTVDVISILAAGMCFGAAVVVLAMTLGRKL